MKKLLFKLFWKEIRNFARWSMHSGHCSQSISNRDLDRYFKEKKLWEKTEHDLIFYKTMDKIRG